MNKLFVFAAFFLLTGCASQQKIAQINATRDDAQCRSYGAAPGSGAYIGCRSQAASARTNAQAIEDASPGPTVCNRVGNSTICN